MREVNPMDTDRAKSWQLYIDAPMPCLLYTSDAADD